MFTRLYWIKDDHQGNRLSYPARRTCERTGRFPP